MLFIQYLKQLQNNHKYFFIFVISLISLYGLQFVFKCEITPLGYFSLYSNPTKSARSYHQILAVNRTESEPLNIYQARGSGFLMMEILPQRYKILSESINCNQMHEKLRAIGLSSGDGSDCPELKKFKKWFPLYANRVGIELDNYYTLYDFGFFNGEIIDSVKIRVD